MSFQKRPWRPLWTGKVYDSGYQYESLKKVEKEDKTGLLQQLPNVGAIIERDGYQYEYRVHDDFGPQISRKEIGAIPNQRPNPIQQSLQQQTESRQQQQQPTPLTDIEASLQALHLKIDKLLEVHTVTNKVEFRNANAMKDDHGNEVSGSDAASSGIDIQQGIMNDEQTDEEAEQEVESH